MILDFQQQAAVLSPHQNTLVLAGAGSGKTRVLVERVAYLIEKQKASPYDIIALTFTRKAAQEMVRRLRERIGRDANHIRIGTLHALALRFIRMYGDLAGIRPKSFTVYGPWEEDFLLKDTAKLVKAKPGYGQVLQEYYQTGVEPDAGSPHRRLFDVFLNRLRQNNSMTYGLLLTTMAKLMPEIIKRIINHVLVDEVQDIDLLQWQIIRAFQALRAKCTLFAVGDQDQSIFEFRGAVPTYLSAMQSSFRVYRLENNYRSVISVVEAANRLIGNNVRRIEKTMHPHRTEYGVRSVMYEMNSRATADLILALQKEHPNIAVMSRTHRLLEALSKQLRELNVEHHYCGRQAKIMDTEQFRRVHAILKLVSNPYDNFAFALARPVIGVSDSRYADIMEQSLESYESHLQAWLKTPAADRWKPLFIDGHGWRLSQILDFVTSNAEGFDESISFCFEAARLGTEEAMTLQEYLDWVATYDIQEDVVVDPKREGIQLMTIHAAKGLEFHTVVVIGLNEGHLPTRQAIARDDVEEERRLAYVAMTRAEDNLFLLVRPESGKDGSASGISRFISELRSACLQ